MDKQDYLIDTNPDQMLPDQTPDIELTKEKTGSSDYENEKSETADKVVDEDKSTSISTSEKKADSFPPIPEDKTEPSFTETHLKNSDSQQEDAGIQFEDTHMLLKNSSNQKEDKDKNTDFQNSFLDVLSDPMFSFDSENDKALERITEVSDLTAVQINKYKNDALDSLKSLEESKKKLEELKKNSLQTLSSNMENPFSDAALIQHPENDFDQSKETALHALSKGDSLIEQAQSFLKSLSALSDSSSETKLAAKPLDGLNTDSLNTDDSNPSADVLSDEIARIQTALGLSGVFTDHKSDQKQQVSDAVQSSRKTSQNDSFSFFEQISKILEDGNEKADEIQKTFSKNEKDS